MWNKNDCFRVSLTPSPRYPVQNMIRITAHVLRYMLLRFFLLDLCLPTIYKLCIIMQVPQAHENIILRRVMMSVLCCGCYVAKFAILDTSGKTILTETFHNCAKIILYAYFTINISRNILTESGRDEVKTFLSLLNIQLPSPNCCYSPRISRVVSMQI